MAEIFRNEIITVRIIVAWTQSQSADPVDEISQHQPVNKGVSCNISSSSV